VPAKRYRVVDVDEKQDRGLRVEVKLKVIQFGNPPAMPVDFKSLTYAAVM